jgi:phosphate-selective porin OprO/OprP
VESRRDASLAFALSLVALLVPTVVSAQTATRPSSPPATVDVGLGRGLTIRSSDETSTMNIRARIQARGTARDNVDDTLPATSEALVRRMRLVFQGNALGPRFTYYIQLGFSNLDTEADLRLPLRDAYMTWAPNRSVNVRVGQMKVPFSRQRVVSSSAQQMVDRSLVVTELNLDRDVGVQLFSKDLFGTGRLGYALGLFGGDGRNRQGRTAGSLYTARLEAWPFGAFDDYVEGDLSRLSAWRLAFGANVAYNQNTNRPRSTIGDPYPAGDFDYTHAGIDMLLKKRGCSAQFEWMYRKADRDQQIVTVNGAPTVITSRSGWGAYAQGGCLVTARTEVSGRLGHLAPTEGRTALFAATDELSLGIGYYVREHNLKLQTDYVHESATGLDTHHVRTQLQLFF